LFIDSIIISSLDNLRITIDYLSSLDYHETIINSSLIDNLKQTIQLPATSLFVDSIGLLSSDNAKTSIDFVQSLTNHATLIIASIVKRFEDTFSIQATNLVVNSVMLSSSDNQQTTIVILQSSSFGSTSILNSAIGNVKNSFQLFSTQFISDSIILSSSNDPNITIDYFASLIYDGTEIPASIVIQSRLFPRSEFPATVDVIPSNEISPSWIIHSRALFDQSGNFISNSPGEISSQFTLSNQLAVRDGNDKVGTVQATPEVQGNTGMATGAIIGITLAVLAVIALIILAIMFSLRRPDEVSEWSNEEPGQELPTSVTVDVDSELNVSQVAPGSSGDSVWDSDPEEQAIVLS
jgi:hypothetical protein